MAYRIILGSHPPFHRAQSLIFGLVGPLGVVQVQLNGVRPLAVDLQHLAGALAVCAGLVVDTIDVILAKVLILLRPLVGGEPAAVTFDRGAAVRSAALT